MSGYDPGKALQTLVKWYVCHTLNYFEIHTYLQYRVQLYLKPIRVLIVVNFLSPVPKGIDKKWSEDETVSALQIQFILQTSSINFLLILS